MKTADWQDKLKALAARKPEGFTGDELAEAAFVGYPRGADAVTSLRQSGVILQVVGSTPGTRSRRRNLYRVISGL